MTLYDVIAATEKTDVVKTVPSAQVVAPKPFLQWVGGKREFISRYPEVLDIEFSTYYEPFLGGGAMMFAMSPLRAVVGDSNDELINAYCVVRDDVEQLIVVLEQLQARHSKDFYMKVRELDRQTTWQHEDAVSRAARFLYLNKTGFNGVYRVNRKGQYNVPIGSTLNKLICDPAVLKAASEFFTDKEFLHGDFAEVVSSAQEGDFVYFDPPYVPLGGYADFTRYTKEQFDLTDQERLQEVFSTLSARGVKVMMSNSDTDVVRHLYKDFNLTQVYSSRNLSSKSATRRAVPELVVTNYEVSLGKV